MFAHIVPSKRLTYEQGSQDLLQDLQKLGYHGVIVKCDEGPALRSAQEEVHGRREATDILTRAVGIVKPIGQHRELVRL